MLGEKLEISEDPGVLRNSIETSYFVDIMDTKNKDAMDCYISCADHLYFRNRKFTRNCKSIAHQVYYHQFATKIFCSHLDFLQGLDEGRKKTTKCCREILEEK